MNKEEFEQLKSTVKQWLFHTGSLDPTNYANELKVKFIEPREKRIAELKEENKVLAQNLEDTEILNKTYEKRFSDLEKANAELKLKLEALEGQTPWKDIKDKSEVIGQLTKAKEIIKTFLGFAEAFGYSPSMDKFISEAEQFLNCSEKPNNYHSKEEQELNNAL